MIPLVTEMIAATQRLSADQIALVPSRLIDDIILNRNFLLAFALGSHGEGREGAAMPVALMTATRAESATRFIAQYCVGLERMRLVAWDGSKG